MSFAMLMGFWPLKSCSVSGPFQLQQLVQLLPNSLQHLKIELQNDVLDTNTSIVVMLDIATDLPALQSLDIN